MIDYKYITDISDKPYTGLELGTNTRVLGFERIGVNLTFIICYLLIKGDDTTNKQLKSAAKPFDNNTVGNIK